MRITIPAFSSRISHFIHVFSMVFAIFLRCSQGTPRARRLLPCLLAPFRPGGRRRGRLHRGGGAAGGAALGSAGAAGAQDGGVEGGQTLRAQGADLGTWGGKTSGNFWEKPEKCWEHVSRGGVAIIKWWLSGVAAW